MWFFLVLVLRKKHAWIARPHHYHHVFPFFAAGHLLLPLPMQSTSATRMLEEPSNSFISLSQSLQTLSYSIDFNGLMIHEYSWCVLWKSFACLKDLLMFSSETWWLLKKPRGPRSYLRRPDTGFIFLQWPHLLKANKKRASFMATGKYIRYISISNKVVERCWKGCFQHKVCSTFKRLSTITFGPFLPGDHGAKNLTKTVLPLTASSQDSLEKNREDAWFAKWMIIQHDASKQDLVLAGDSSFMDWGLSTSYWTCVPRKHRLS